MKNIMFYAAVVLAALISCTGAEAKRYHHHGKRAITKTVTVKHGHRHAHRHRAVAARHHTPYRRAIDGVLVDRDGWRQTASWDNSCFSLLYLHSMYACSGHGGS
jgi:hypothetical protein